MNLLISCDMADYPLTDAHIDRFWKFVRKDEQCWEWTGSKWSSGYGSFFVANRKAAVHRVSYQINVGTIPEGLVIDHLCRNKSCVNPDHLEPVTSGENQRRGYEAGREPRGLGLTAKGERIGGALTHLAKTHCPQGHPYSGDNLYLWRNQRHCKTCMRERQIARRGGDLPT